MMSSLRSIRWTNGSGQTRSQPFIISLIELPMAKRGICYDNVYILCSVVHARNICDRSLNTHCHLKFDYGWIIKDLPQKTINGYEICAVQNTKNAYNRAIKHPNFQPLPQLKTHSGSKFHFFFVRLWIFDDWFKLNIILFLREHYKIGLFLPFVWLSRFVAGAIVREVVTN